MNGTPLFHGNGVHRGRGIMNGTPTSDRNSKMKMVRTVSIVQITICTVNISWDRESDCDPLSVLCPLQSCIALVSKSVYCHSSNREMPILICKR